MSEKKPVNRSDHIAPHESVFDRDLALPSHNEIANLAQVLWERRGGGDGGALDDWLGAERLLLKQSRKGNAA
jgi:hypothetical protein